AFSGDIVDTLHQREYFDYIYRAGDLAELAGDKYQSKRNFVNRFKKNHNFEYKILNADTAALCLGVQKKWREMKLYTAPASILDEDTAAREFLENFTALDLCGCAIFVGADIIAFSVGERLNGDTLVMHLEKADTSYAGSYQTMSRLAAKTAVSMGYAYINKEEDLGLPNLRKAKMSYHPAAMVRKYEIKVRS
ncbi:MAG: phosphatidylglycerol lysyltransferase domain-containing protein, partial [Endomicrobiia bacterium]|nr:phosphatidylglycerol lysyltransferase domain-containing protein [Endomicrobiia bacterium]